MVAQGIASCLAGPQDGPPFPFPRDSPGPPRHALRVVVRRRTPRRDTDRARAPLACLFASWAAPQVRARWGGGSASWRDDHSTAPEDLKWTWTWTRQDLLGAITFSARCVGRVWRDRQAAAKTWRSNRSFNLSHLSTARTGPWMMWAAVTRSFEIFVAFIEYYAARWVLPGVRARSALAKISETN